MLLHSTARSGKPAGRRRPARRGGAVLSLAVAGALALAAATVASGPAEGPASAPSSDLDFWLGQAKPTTTTAAIRPPPADPFGRGDRFGRGDALPGVVVLSDDEILAGGIHTTRDRNWEVWVESEQRWRHIPPLAVLSVRAVVLEEKMDREWRWKEMGSDEKVDTDRTRPTRRLQWRFHLIDDSHVTGTIKGQPLWVESAGKRRGPFVLHERSAGKYGQTLKDLIYVKEVVISRRAMERALK